MLEHAISEIHNVAIAKNIVLPKEAKGEAMNFIDSLPPDSTTSMQRDIINGHPSELEAQNGAVVRLGQEVNVETPINAFIYHSLLPLEMRARGQVQFEKGATN